MAITLTGIETETYTGHMVAEYKNVDIFGSRGMQYYGMVPTEVLNQPVITTGEGSHYADGSDHTLEDSSITGVEIPLWTPPYKVRSSVTQTQLDIHPDHNYIGNLGTDHGKQMGNHKTKLLTNFLYGTADANGQLIDADENNTTHATAAEAVRGAVEEVMAAMDVEGVPPTGRWGLLKPSAYYKLNAVQGVIRKDWGGPANVQSINKMTILEYLNCNIRCGPLGFGQDWTDSAYNGVNMPADTEIDMSGALGVFWHSDSWALREQTQPVSSVDPIPEKQIIQIMSRQLMGANDILPSGIWGISQA